MDRIKIGLSRCLLGDKVRYDGKSKRNDYIADTLGRYVEFIPLCPETESGLTVPREAMRLEGDPDEPRLVTIYTGIDHTEKTRAWAERKLDEIAVSGICGFIFKSRSPSCGKRGLKIHNSKGNTGGQTAGIFAGAFLQRFPFMPTEEESHLNDPDIRANFIERVFVYPRWLEFLEKGDGRRDLVEFHARHKLILLAHSPKEAAALGRYVAGAEDHNGRLNDVYARTLMKALCRPATVKKNINVLSHIMGYFKKRLPSDEKEELLGMIDDYRRGITPLLAPLSILNNYVRRYHVAYLTKQFYLNPHPLELMLRYHA